MQARCKLAGRLFLQALLRKHRVQSLLLLFIAAAVGASRANP